jgi:hypothetical protein
MIHKQSSSNRNLITVELGKTTSDAQREYNCACCTHKIKVGEKHLKYVLLDENEDIQTKRFHLRCDINPEGGRVDQR